MERIKCNYIIKNTLKYIVIIIASLCTTIALMMHEEMQPNYTTKLLITLIFIGFIICYNKLFSNTNKISKVSIILAFILSLFKYTQLTKDSNSEFIYFFKYLKISFKYSVIVIVGYTILYYAIIEGLYYLFNKLKKTKFNVLLKTNKILNFIFEIHPFILTAIIILILWLPHIIIQYPGAVAWDTDAEIAKYLEQGEIFSSHFPVFHIWLVRIYNYKVSKSFW